VTYDLANTIFAFGVVGYGFVFWMTDNGVSDGVLGRIEGIAGLIVAFIAPWLGARTDFRGRRLATLAATTLLAVVGTVLLGLGPQWMTFVALGFAIIGFQVGSAIYDALLPDVSTPATRGRVSGLGVGVGYVGSFVGLGIFYLMQEVLDESYAATFMSLGLAFLFFSIPTFVYVRERPRPRPHGEPPSLSKTASHLVAAWRRASGYPDVVRFLISRFLYTDATNTLLGGFLTLFVTEELGFSRGFMLKLAAVVIGFAVPGGLIAGRMVGQYGPLRVLSIALCLVVVGIVSAIVAALSGWLNLVWVIGPLGGAALGAIWSADRVLMARISPPQHFGEFYGLYATVGRFSFILGPLMWAFLVDNLHLGRNVAMGALICFLLAALWVLRRVDDRERQWDHENRD
jgi:UMF1 family MFS transporter